MQPTMSGCVRSLLLPLCLAGLVLGWAGCSKTDTVGGGGTGGRPDASDVNIRLDAGQGGTSGNSGAGGGSSGGAPGDAVATPADTGPRPGCTGRLAVTDPALEAAIRAELELPTGDILPEHLAKLTTLDASEKQIASLAGIECLSALTSIDLSYDPITDLSPLASLVQLKGLGLRGLRTVDLTPLAPLVNLTSLSLGYNTTHIAGFGVVAGMTKLSHVEVYSADLDDISPLAGCTQLYHLMIANNKVTDLTPIPNFKRLDFLELYDNHITDISPLANMSTVLTLLRLGNNQISDISPLGRWAGSSKLDTLDLSDNDITDLSPLLSIPNLDLFTFDLTGNPIDCTAQAANIAALTAIDRSLRTDCR